MAAAQISIPLPRGEARLPEASSPEAPSPEAPPPEVPLSDMPGTTIPLPGAPPSAPQSTIVQTPMGAHGRPDINPYDRDIDMTVPLTFQARSLGDTPLDRKSVW